MKMYLQKLLSFSVLITMMAGFMPTAFADETAVTAVDSAEPVAEQVETVVPLPVDPSLLDADLATDANTNDEQVDQDIVEPLSSPAMLDETPNFGFDAILSDLQAPSEYEENMWNGAFSFSIPIETPAGRNGVEPSLSFDYNSQDQAKEHLIGYGWDVSIPNISIINRNGVEEMYSDPIYSSSLSGELENISGEIYGAKVNSGDFISYEFVDSEYWLATDKFGKIYTFAESVDSRQNDPSVPENVSKWMLERVEDANSNFMTYEYDKLDGQIYPTRISYTGHGLDEGIFEVLFHWDFRADTRKDYSRTYEVETNKRLSQVEILVSSEWVRKYDIAYTVPEYGMRSLIQGVTESVRSIDGEVTVLDPTTFDYTVAEKYWEESRDYYFPEVIYSANVAIVDVNGDGFSDILLSNYSPDSRRTFINNADGSGWSEDPSFVPPVAFTDRGGAREGVRLADLNGDARVDFVRRYGVINEVYINEGTGIGWVLDPSYVIPNDINFDSPDGSSSGGRFGEFNGDGLIDMIFSTRFSSRVFINNADGTWFEDPAYIVPPAITFDEELGVNRYSQIYDINGDGLDDFLYSGISDRDVYFNQGDGTGWALDEDYEIPIAFQWGADWNWMSISLLDVNGDGMVDIVESDTPTHTYINSGSAPGWEEDPEYVIPLRFDFIDEDRSGTRFGDVNGDGLTDILYQSTGAHIVYMNASDNPVHLLSSITHKEGGSTAVKYKASSTYESEDGLANKDLPFILHTVESIVTNDGLGLESEVSYVYAGGFYYYQDEIDKKLAGFAEVTRTEADRKVINYYHQGNSTDPARGEYEDHISKVGKVYRTEVYDSSDNLYQVNLNKWDMHALDAERDFVFKEEKVAMSYDGDADHKDTAESYSYNLTNGNLLELTKYGEVTASDDGSFLNVLNDEAEYSVSMIYVSNPDLPGYLTELILYDRAGAEVSKSRQFYDDLPYGEVTLGNKTKDLVWLDTSDDWLSTTYTYDEYGLVGSSTNPRGYSSAVVYDANNLYPNFSTNHLGHTVETIYEPVYGNLLSEVSANGVETSYEYDGLGRLLKLYVPDPQTGASTMVEMHKYFDDVFPEYAVTMRRVDGVISKERAYFDGLGRLIQEWQPAESGYIFVDTWYDDSGNVSQQSLPYAKTGTSWSGRDLSAYAREMFYDALSRPISETLPTGTVTTEFDQWSTTVTDANGHDKDFHYDGFGNLIGVTEHNGGDSYDTSYYYDVQNNLKKLVDAQGHLRNFSYDSLSRLTQQEGLHRDGFLFKTWDYTYDANGNVKTQWDPNDKYISWTYDELDRVLTEDWLNDGSVDVNYTYDTAANGLGFVDSIEMDALTTSYDYNAIGLPRFEHKIIGPISESTETLFDTLGRAKAVIYPDGELIVYNEYNVAGRLESVSDSAGTVYVSNIDYSPVGAPSRIDYGNGLIAMSVYDPAQAYRLVSKGALSSGDIIQNLSYTYDGASNITDILDNSVTSTNKTVHYTYDDLDRLETATSSGFASGDYALNYAYDAVGNMICKSDLTDVDCLAGEENITYGGVGVVHPHAPSTVAGSPNIYDNNGNLVDDSDNQMVWSVKNEMLRYLSIDGSIIHSYTYDHTGQRIKANKDGEETIYLNSYVEQRPEGRVLQVYADSIRVATINTEDDTSYHVQDHLGGNTLTTNEAGALTHVYDFAPFGAQLLNEDLGDSDSQYSFTGKEFDDTTDLYYFEARYYSPTSAHFTSLDPMQLRGVPDLIMDPQQLNAYAYARNNPLTFVDPTGEAPEDFSWNPLTWDWE
ncbi:hypothetical protein HOD30_02205, partial [Candidatus Peregrinibacteria bacterium]|nr:hypothetical protein [Candidatus Peregrinibacteria bacterium]